MLHPDSNICSHGDDNVFADAAIWEMKSALLFFGSCPFASSLVSSAPE